MKIFSWMQNKLNGRQNINKIDSLQVAADKKVYKETKKEVMAWPDGLLTIGTFGINNLKDPPNSPRKSNLDDDDDDEDIPQTDDDDDDDDDEQLVVKEFMSLQKGSSLPPENILEILRSLREGNESNGESSSLSKDVQRLRDDDSQLDKKKSIRKRAFHFLLKKKTFLGGFKPMFSPILKDPLELKLDKSRMEKILRAILHKQVHPQGSTQKSSARKCLDTKRVTCNKYQEEALEIEEEEGEEEGIKWVKTDSEYIVLEI